MTDDLISRQVAIAYAISGLTREIDGENWIRVSEVRENIKALSSAQTEAKPPKWVAEDRYIKYNFKVYPHCPQCNAEIITGDCYCRICGQHIDWSEDDE